MLSTTGDINLQLCQDWKSSTPTEIKMRTNSAFSSVSHDNSDINSKQPWSILNQRMFEDVVVSNLLGTTGGQLLGSLMLNQYCFWSTSFSTPNSTTEPQLLATDNLKRRVIYKPTPVLAKSQNEEKTHKSVRCLSSSETQADLACQQNDWKSVYSSSDMGEQVEDPEKLTYIKSIFHITRINKKTMVKRRINRHRHVISHWEHVGEQYYARGMCKKWYFSKGNRKKKATKWEHTDSSHYATGLCKLWYLKNYHKTHDRKC